VIEQLQFPELVDITGAAAHLSTSVRHVRRLVQDGALPFVKIGGKLRFDKADLQRYIEERRHPGKQHEPIRLAQVRHPNVPNGRRPTGSSLFE